MAGDQHRVYPEDLEGGDIDTPFLFLYRSWNLLSAFIFGSIVTDD